MALEKAMGSMVLEKIMVEYKEDKQVLEKTIYIIYIYIYIYILARAKFSFAGFGKDHHVHFAMSKKSDYVATKNIDWILIGY